MKKAFLIAALIALLIFPAFGHATVIDNQRVDIDLGSGGSAHIITKTDYAELTSADVPYIVFGSWKNFAARDSGGELSCAPTPQTYGAYFLCKPNSADRKNYSVTFEFDLSYTVTKAANAYLFSYLHGAGEPTKKLDVFLLLPEGTGIVKGTVVQPYSPDAEVGSTGRRVTLEWIVSPVELGKTYSFTANYEQVGQIINYYGNYSRIIAIIFAVAFVFVLLKYRVFGRRYGARSVMDVLKEDERKVMEIVMAAKDKCKQNAIVAGTNFSKAKVSRILTDLEARGVIRKIPVGRTNRVVLAEKKERVTANAEAQSSEVEPQPSGTDAGGFGKAG